MKKIVRKLCHKTLYGKKIYNKAEKIKIIYNKKKSDIDIAGKYYYKENKKRLSLDNPVGFSQKLWWLKLNNRDPLLTVCTDKYLVREYIKSKGYSNILNELYGVYESAEDINFDNLPEEVFFKCNHASGYNYKYKRDDKFNRTKFNKRFNEYLKENYYWKSREWNYKNIKPLIVAEKVIPNSEKLLDYKFFCFDGKVEFLTVQMETVKKDGTQTHKLKKANYDRDFNYKYMKLGVEPEGDIIPKPKNFEYMIEVAESLSDPFPICRVDLYNDNGKVLFGEITFYHAGGNQVIEPLELERYYGDLIDLNSSKIVRKKGHNCE